MIRQIAENFLSQGLIQSGYVSDDGRGQSGVVILHHLDDFAVA